MATMNAARQSLSFSRRAIVLGGAQGAFGLMLVARMAYISVAENEKYALLSESNRVNLTLIPPRRGWFVDRNGKPLADNRSDFRVDIIPDRLVDREATVATLASLLDLGAEDLTRINRELDRARGFQPVQVASGLDWERYARVTVRLPELPGVSPRQGYSRHYPAGAAVGHLLGYVGTVSAEEYQERRDPLLITPGYRIGKDGLEKVFEERVRGEPGAKRVEVTARGRIVRELTTRQDVQGLPVRLTIDADLQRYAASRLGPESGSVVVMDTVTGDILALASMPSFDPNSFSDGIGVSEWQWLSGDDHVPLRNKPLKGLYPPGSTVKPMVALALLRAGVAPTDRIGCSGRARIAGGAFHCWRRGGHGSVDMAKAIYQSCDIYFYQMAIRVGMQPIADMARLLGLGEEYPLPVTSQSYGTVPDPAWKMRRFKQPWESYDSVNATIGQGYMLSNPVQLAVMAARLATGRRVMPRLTPDRTPSLAHSLAIPDDHIALVRRAMADVVSGIGTAPRAALPLEEIRMAGKTGTAQVRRITSGERASGVRSNASLPWKLRDHGLFVAFAPFDNPRYACAVVIEHGGGSGAAYPIARDVITFLYDRGKALEELARLEQGWGGTIEERMARDLGAFRASRAAAPAPLPPASAAPPAPASGAAG